MANIGGPTLNLPGPGLLMTEPKILISPAAPAVITTHRLSSMGVG